MKLKIVIRIGDYCEKSSFSHENYIDCFYKKLFLEVNHEMAF